MTTCLNVDRRELVNKLRFNDWWRFFDTGNTFILETHISMYMYLCKSGLSNYFFVIRPRLCFLLFEALYELLITCFILSNECPLQLK